VYSTLIGTTMGGVDLIEKAVVAVSVAYKYHVGMVIGLVSVTGEICMDQILEDVSSCLWRLSSSIVVVQV
jgi:hypothetical protein